MISLKTAHGLQVQSDRLAFGETSASWSHDSSSTEGGSSDLSCKAGLGTFRVLETMTVLTAVSTRRCARTARALLSQLRRAQLHLVHKSFQFFSSNRIHLTLYTKVISLNIKRNQTKNTHQSKTTNFMNSLKMQE